MQSGETRANLCVDLVTRETEALKLDEKAPVAEKLGAPEDAP
jgi:hypothetical protein